jgi:hypothetical protein
MDEDNLPHQIYVYADGEGADRVLMAYESVQEMDREDVLVGVYTLQDTGRLVTNRRIDVRKK